MFERNVLRLNYDALLVSSGTGFCKHLENLLEGGLRDGVLGYIEHVLVVFNQTEHKADGFVLAQHPQFEIVGVMLE